MKYYLVCNPGSSGGRSRKRLKTYTRLLEHSGADFVCRYTRTLDEATLIAREGVRSGTDVVVAIGGDGTINRVINGLVGRDDKAGQCTMGVLYSGTSPDFCRFHGIPTAPPQAVSALLDGESKPIDVCRIRYRGEGGDECVRHFGCSANIGLGSDIAGQSNKYRKYLGDFLGTLLATMVAIVNSRSSAFRLLIDGRWMSLDSVINVTIGKNPHIASGLKLDLDISANDGRMFIFAAVGLGKLSFLSLLPKVYSGSIARDDRFVLRWASSVRLEAEGDHVQVEFDGDPAGRCPVDVEIVPGAINLIGAGS